MNEIKDWFPQQIKTIHFIGIGGIGMSGLAEIMQNLGFNVQGSDCRDSERLHYLKEKGISIFIGHRAEYMHSVDVIVYSSAIPVDNPERVFGRKHKIIEIRRAELLAELMRLRYGIAVSGAHGKTTTTSIIAAVLNHAGLDPSVVVGGNANNIGNNVKIGSGKYFVAEADESDKSFLLLAPVIAVVTNIEEEHLDCYGNLDNILQAFSAFLNRIPFFGAAVVCGDDANILGIIKKLNRKIITYGFHARNDLRISGIQTDGSEQHFQVVRNDALLGEFTVHVPGMHTILNAVAAIAVALELGVSVPLIKEGLGKYTGVKRRLEVKGAPQDILIIDDYAHHPTEISASLHAVRQAWNRPVTAVFQPHRFTRTKYFLDAFAEVLSRVDRLIVLPVYAASEEAIPGINSEILVNRCREISNVDCHCIESIDEAVKYLDRTSKSGDLVITLGAGSVFQVADKLNRVLSDQ